MGARAGAGDAFAAQGLVSGWLRPSIPGNGERTERGQEGRSALLQAGPRTRPSPARLRGARLGFVQMAPRACRASPHVRPGRPTPLLASVCAAFSAWRTGEGGAVRTRILGLPTGVHTECHCVRLNRASPAGSHSTGTPRTPASTDVGFSQSRVPTRLPVRGCHLPGRGLGGDGRGERQHTAKLRAHPRKGTGDEGDSWSSPRGSARVPSPPPFKAISTFHTDVIP